jgi:hypothetical protein
VALTGARYVPHQVQPPPVGYLAVIVAIPLVSVFGALVSLRTVRIDPMGVVRKTRKRRGTRWAAVLLPIGVVLFELPSKNGNFFLVYLGLVLVFAGLISCGVWLTGIAARLVLKWGHGPNSLLAGRRLMDDSRAAFRSVSGLVIAVFIGTATAAIVPALISHQVNAGGGTLTNVMRTSFTSKLSLGLDSAQGAKVLDSLRGVPDLTVLPMYSYVTPGTPIEDAIACGYGGGCTAGVLVVTCAGLQEFSALGACPPGAAPDVTGAFAPLLLTDNMLDIDHHLPVVGRNSRTGALDLSSMQLGAVLVESDRPDSLELARTLLTPYTRLTGASASPQTFAEVAQARTVLIDEVQSITLVAVALTLLVAGASLAVAVAGGMVERKRPFTLLRLTGVPLSALYRVALLEALMPLIVAGVVAVGTGLLVAGPVVRQLAPKGASAFVLPGASYLVTAGVGLCAAIGVLIGTLPLLGRITRPQTARFE